MKNKPSGKCSIYLAFRFHGNFYHSYRGDTPDELGFGKDIRIIRHIISVLDEFNSRGIDVRGTWDFENYFSLEKIMPEYCPDIIDSMKRRVREGRDEIEIMSYNNGLVSAHTAREFEDSIKLSMSNSSGSGAVDIFGKFAPMVRPQEMLFTPTHLRLYKHYGIDSISLFYSSLPFNAFSNFVPELNFFERYNPLNLTYPGIEEAMTLLPAYNAGDLVDNISLRRWVKRIRKEQLRMKAPGDMLLLIDMDADDEFWYGFRVPVIDRFYSLARGLSGLVESVSDLDFIEFTTPCSYLENHAPVKSISFGQDTADGSFDGISSWVEKWSNQMLWTGIERSRVLHMQAEHLKNIFNINNSSMDELLKDSCVKRLRSLSTTHFGMASPVMNLTRLKTAKQLVDSCQHSAAESFRIASENMHGNEKVDAVLTLMDYPRGLNSEVIQFKTKPSRALVKLPLCKGAKPELQDRAGGKISGAVHDNYFYFIENFKPGEIKEYRVYGKQGEPESGFPHVTAGASFIANEHVHVSFDENGGIEPISYNGVPTGGPGFLGSSVTYGKKRYNVKQWEPVKSGTEGNGLIGFIRHKGRVSIDSSGREVIFERELLLARDLPYIYISMKIIYPQTEFMKYDRGKAERLERKWDGRWKEVMPCEIKPGFFGKDGSELRIWKHNYLGHVSTYKLNYGSFSKNSNLDSSNNQVTNSWSAVSNGSEGLLIAQSVDSICSMGFLNIRTEAENGTSRISLNPFGSYYGRQMKYATAHTGIGKFLAVHASAADHLAPYAPSYNGKIQEFSLMLAPYSGDSPPENIQNDALAYTYPYIALSDPDIFVEPSHRKPLIWEI